MLSVALLSGMRRSELFDLAWENVDLERNVIFIPRTKSGIPRHIPIGGKLRIVLMRQEPQRTGPIFNINKRQLRRDFENTIKEAGILNFKFHDCRHTFASYYVMAGGDLLSLSRLLGHTSTAMTERYAHLAADFLAHRTVQFEAAIPLEESLPRKVGHNLGTIAIRPTLNMPGKA